MGHAPHLSSCYSGRCFRDSELTQEKWSLPMHKFTSSCVLPAQINLTSFRTAILLGYAILENEEREQELLLRKGLLPCWSNVVSYLFEMGPKDTGARQNFLLLYSYSGSFPWSPFSLSYPYNYALPCLLNVVLIEFYSISKQNVGLKLSQWFHLAKLHLFPKHQHERPFNGETKRDLYCFPFQTDKFLYISLLYFLAPFLWCSAALS